MAATSTPPVAAPPRPPAADVASRDAAHARRVMAGVSLVGVSLPDCAARRRRLRRSARDLGLPLQICDGVRIDAANYQLDDKGCIVWQTPALEVPLAVGADTLRVALPAAYSGTTTPSVLGCLCAHLRALVLLCRGIHPLGVVVEDDCLLDPAAVWPTTLEQFAAGAPPDWEGITLTTGIAAMHNAEERQMARGEYDARPYYGAFNMMFNVPRVRAALGRLGLAEGRLAIPTPDALPYNRLGKLTRLASDHILHGLLRFRFNSVRPFVLLDNEGEAFASQIGDFENGNVKGGVHGSKNAIRAARHAKLAADLRAAYEEMRAAHDHAAAGAAVADCAPAPEDAHFVAIITMRDARDYVERSVGSVCQQLYGDWHAIVVDDASSDGSLALAQGAARRFGCSDRFTFLQNDERMYPAFSRLRAYRHASVRPEHVLVLLDGDDWLKDGRVFARLARAYRETDCLVTHGCFEYWDGEDTPARHSPFHGRLPPETLRDGAHRRHPHRMSHLRTMRAATLRGVRLEDVLGPDGTLLRRCTDVNEMALAVDVAGDRVEYIPETLLTYNRQNSRQYSTSYFNVSKAANEKLVAFVQGRQRADAPEAETASPVLSVPEAQCPPLL